MSPEPLLDRNLHHDVEQEAARVRRLVDEVTLSLHAGGTLGIVGEIGIGSTLRLTDPARGCRRRASSADG